MFSSAVRMPTVTAPAAEMTKRSSLAAAVYCHGPNIIHKPRKLVTCKSTKNVSLGSDQAPNSTGCRRLGAAATLSAAVAEERLPLPAGDLCLPRHIAIIMDGHGRWAEQRGLTAEHGHRAGAATLKSIISAACCKYGIKVLSLYAFSTENWGRSKREIDFLMANYEDFIRSTVMDLIIRHDMRFSVIGTKSRLPPSMQSAICLAEESSQANKGMHFVMALSYSGRLDMTEASKKIAREVKNGTLRVEDINEDVLEQHLMTNFEFPNPDLLIRTSGELRMSNFMMWQLAYTEFYFADKMFPDFDEAQFVEALACFQRRKRRYGGRNK